MARQAPFERSARLSSRPPDSSPGSLQGSANSSNFSLASRRRPRGAPRRSNALRHSAPVSSWWGLFWLLGGDAPSHHRLLCAPWVLRFRSGLSSCARASVSCRRGGRRGVLSCTSERRLSVAVHRRGGRIGRRLAGTLAYGRSSQCGGTVFSGGCPLFPFD